MIRLLSISILCLFLTGVLFAQPAERRITRSEYIDKYKEDAIQEMHHSGVPASITLAQGILESGDGNSPLALYANNHFGIKCHTTWKGETFIMDDDEKNECFRKYNSAYESFKDHSEFLTSRSRYAALFELNITDYKGWARGLKEAGYATNPKYADLLIALIEKHELNQYDNYAKVPSKQLAKNKTSSILAESQSKRVVKLRNNVKYTFVNPSDDVASIARDFNLNTWQVYKYNDLNKTDKLTDGEIIYLQPKRNKAAEEFHTVKSGETMRTIAQLHGVKLKKLYKKNNMFVGTHPQVGQKLSLRNKIKE
jgi:LysM repeat protein